MLAAMPSALCFLALASLVASSPVPDAALPGARQAADAPTVRAIDVNWTRDGLITGVSGALWLTSEAFIKTQLAPSKCRWCDRSPDGQDTLNTVDRWGRGLAARTEGGREAWDTWSNVIDFGVLPVGVLGAQYLLSSGSGAPVLYYAEDAMMIVETAAVAALANQVVKFAVGRERPFVHVLDEEQKSLGHNPNDNNLSFYSGHTSLAFSLAVAAGTTAELRNYRAAPAVWAVGVPLATLSGYLRIAADRHHLTDVLVGALVGSGVGALTTWLLHRPE